MKDKITIILDIEADFKTLQDIRQKLNDDKLYLSHRIKNLLNDELANIGQFNLSVNEFKSPKKRKTSRGKRNPIPRLIDGILYEYNTETNEFDTVGRIGSYEFLNFLDWQRSFSYRTDYGLKFTAIKQGKVWYARKQVGGNVKRIYIGDHNDFTERKLYEIAFKLAQRKLIEKTENNQKKLV